MVDLAKGAPDMRQLGADPAHGALEAVQESPADHPLDCAVAVVLLDAGLQDVLLGQERRVDATCTALVDEYTAVHGTDEELPLACVPDLCLVVHNVHSHLQVEGANGSRERSTPPSTV